jgi:hypothetical protein
MFEEWQPSSDNVEAAIFRDKSLPLLGRCCADTKVLVLKLLEFVFAVLLCQHVTHGASGMMGDQYRDEHDEDERHQKDGIRDRAEVEIFRPFEFLGDLERLLLDEDRPFVLRISYTHSL